MTDEKKVVIKINYAANAQKHTTGKHAAPQMVTEWNIKRIVVALTVLVLMAAFGIYLWAGRNEERLINPQSSKSTEPVPAEVKKETLLLIEEKGKEIEKVSEETNKDRSIVEEVRIEEKILEEADKDSSKAVEVVKKEEGAVSRNMERELQVSQVLSAGRQENEDKKINEQPSEEKEINIEKNVADASAEREALSIALPKGLTRAVITSSIWKKEPIDTLISPVKINRDQARSIFYFTELKDMKGKTVFHVWKYNGKVKFRKKIRILGNRWRASTSKLMNDTSIGNWAVQLTNAEGEILYEINFNIIES